MKFLVVCRLRPDADRAEFTRRLAAEAAALRTLRVEGVLVEAWTMTEPGAVLILDCPAEADARPAVDGLPLVAAGLLTIELIALVPLQL